MTLQEKLAGLSEDERVRLRQKMNEGPQPFTGFKVTYYFDQKEGLESISLLGEVPCKGEIVYISNWTSGLTERRYDFRERTKWKVKSVVWSMRVGNVWKERMLITSMYHAEVHVVQYETLRTRIRYAWYGIRNFLRRSGRERTKRYYAMMEANTIPDED